MLKCCRRFAVEFFQRQDCSYARHGGGFCEAIILYFHIDRLDYRMGLKSFKHRLITSTPTPAIKSNIHTWFTFASLPTSVSKWPDFNVEDHHWQRQWRSVWCLSPRVRNAAGSTPVHLWDSLGFTLEFCPTVSNFQQSSCLMSRSIQEKHSVTSCGLCHLFLWLLPCNYSACKYIGFRVAYCTSLT